jgi:hypothetical protein
VGFRQDWPSGSLQQVPGCLDRVEDPDLDGTLDRRGVDLVEAKVRAKQGSTLGELPPQRGQRQVLDLVPLCIDPPLGGVHVPHFEPTVAAPGGSCSS